MTIWRWPWKKTYFLSSPVINSTLFIKQFTNFLDPTETTWERAINMWCVHAVFIGLWSALGRLGHRCATHLYQLHTSWQPQHRVSLHWRTKSIKIQWTNQMRPSSKVKTPAAHRAVYSPSDKPAAGCKLCLYNSHRTKWRWQLRGSPATAPGRSTASGRESRNFSRPASLPTSQRMFNPEENGKISNSKFESKKEATRSAKLEICLPFLP